MLISEVRKIDKIVLRKEDKCPICSKDVYKSEASSEYCCVDVNCPMGHGETNYYTNMWKII